MTAVEQTKDGDTIQVTPNQNLYKLTLSQFDKLLNAGEILWGESIPEVVDYDGFKVEFRITPDSILAKKPIYPPNHPNRSQATSSTNPFVNPDPAFIIATVGESHILLLNKYCILRPQLILHTAEFEKQDEPLTSRDLAATWKVLGLFEREWKRSLKNGVEKGKNDMHDNIQRQAVIYNCGVEGGSSQGHRHLQFFPRQEWIFPDHYTGNVKIPVEVNNQSTGLDAGNIDTAPMIIETEFPHVPYKHAVIRLSSTTTKNEVTTAYRALLKYLRDSTTGEATPHDSQASESKNNGNIADNLVSSDFPHNVFLVPEWIAVIPRRHAKGDGVGANSAGMMGAIWLKDQEEREGWDRLGVRGHLAYLGIPTAQ